MESATLVPTVRGTQGTWKYFISAARMFAGLPVDHSSPAFSELDKGTSGIPTDFNAEK